MKRIGFALALIASPALAQTSTTNCVPLGFGAHCTTTTTTPAPDSRREPLFSVKPQPSQAPAPRPVGREAYTVIEGYIAQGQCAEAAYYARQFNDRAVLDYALTCKPK